MDVLKKAEAFLREIGMHPEQTDIEGTAAAFRALMEAGLRGESDGLPMLPTFLRTGAQVPDAEPVLVADAGGTNLRRALVSEARKYPGQEKFVYEYYEKTPGALAQLRAPLFEDKVVDYVLDQTRTTDKKVTKDELFKAMEAISG